MGDSLSLVELNLLRALLLVAGLVWRRLPVQRERRSRIGSNSRAVPMIDIRCSLVCVSVRMFVRSVSDCFSLVVVGCFSREHCLHVRCNF